MKSHVQLRYDCHGGEPGHVGEKGLCGHVGEKSLCGHVGEKGFGCHVGDQDDDDGGDHHDGDDGDQGDDGDGEDGSDVCDRSFLHNACLYIFQAHPFLVLPHLFLPLLRLLQHYLFLPPPWPLPGLLPGPLPWALPLHLPLAVRKSHVCGGDGDDGGHHA